MDHYELWVRIWRMRRNFRLYIQTQAGLILFVTFPLYPAQLFSCARLFLLPWRKRQHVLRNTCAYLPDCTVPEGSQLRFFYNHGSMHRDSILISSNEVQQYAGVYLLQNYSTCFGCLSHPSSGVHQTVTVASGTGHITYEGKDLLPAWPN